MTDKNKNHDANCFSPQDNDALNEDLKHYGYLLPTNDEEEEEFEKIYGGTQVLVPEKFKTPDFLFEEKSKGKIVAVDAESKKVKDSKPGTKKTATVKPIDKNTYFKRLVLAAEIANQLYEEPTFGHVKFVKIQYLCERVYEMEINTNYGQYAAGPLDPKHIHSIDAEFKKRKWFKVIKREYGYKYEPDQNVDAYKTYFKNYFSKQIDNINYLISLFRKEKSDFCEIVATLFAVWERRLQKGQTNQPAEVYKDFYGWSKEKARFKESQLDEAITWMNEKGVVPVGAR